MIAVGAIGERRRTYAGTGTRELFVEGDGPTIVLVHGFAHPADSWRPVLNRFAEAGQSAVAVDLPGFGAADPVESGPWLPHGDLFLSEVVARHSSTAPVVLIGNSLGAVLTVRAAASPLSLPVAGIVPTGTPGMGWTQLVRAGLICNGRILTTITGIGGVPGLVRGYVADQLVARLLYGDRRALDMEMVRLLTSHVHSRESARELLARAALMKAEVDAAPTVTGVRCPTVIVHGRRDRLVALASSERLHVAIAHSKLVVLDAAGHCPHLDAPQDIVDIGRGLAANPRGQSTPA
ncbi:hypothetical protein BKP30_27745 [Rhodococcus erythropolis]|nr:hypothetical protein BKP30_27745 [Rhodococcus erythropolis]